MQQRTYTLRSPTMHFNLVDALNSGTVHCLYSQSTVRYDTIGEFNVDSRAGCDQLNKSKYIMYVSKSIRRHFLALKISLKSLSKQVQNDIPAGGSIKAP